MLNDTNQQILAQLEDCLPLKKRQVALPDDAKRVYIKILYTLAEEARFPTAQELSPWVTEERFTQILAELCQQDLITADNHQLTGAYPFSIKKTGYTVSINGHHLYAMCAFDAVGISDMFDQEVAITSSCVISKEPVQLVLSNKDIVLVNQPQLQMGIYWQGVDQCAAESLCHTMVFLCDQVIADQWRTSKKSAVTFSLLDGMAISSAFFKPLLE